jgi:hypothetical protein
VQDVNTASESTELTTLEYRQYRRLEGQVRAAERSALMRLREQNQVNDEVLRKMERELDLVDIRHLSDRS